MNEITFCLDSTPSTASCNPFLSGFSQLDLLPISFLLFVQLSNELSGQASKIVVIKVSILMS
jgi:hypothetical protein